MGETWNPRILYCQRKFNLETGVNRRSVIAGNMQKYSMSSRMKLKHGYVHATNKNLLVQFAMKIVRNEYNLVGISRKAEARSRLRLRKNEIYYISI